MFEAGPKTSFLFDLDGMLVDSVYQHVLAWREALAAEGIDLSAWRIHRKIGMSGGLFNSVLLRRGTISMPTGSIACAMGKRRSGVRKSPTGEGALLFHRATIE